MAQEGSSTSQSVTCCTDPNSRVEAGQVDLVRRALPTDEKAAVSTVMSSIGERELALTLHTRVRGRVGNPVPVHGLAVTSLRHLISCLVRVVTTLLAELTGLITSATVDTETAYCLLGTRGRWLRGFGLGFRLAWGRIVVIRGSRGRGRLGRGSVRRQHSSATSISVPFNTKVLSMTLTTIYFSLLVSVTSRGMSWMRVGIGEGKQQFERKDGRKPEE